MQKINKQFLISPDDFEKVAKKTRMKEVTLAIARSLLVEGEDMAAMSRKHGLTPQRIMTIRDDFFNRYLREHMFPPSWVRASVCAPPEMLEKFLADVEAERIQYLSSERRTKES